MLPISYRYKKYTTTIPLLAKRYGMSFLTSPLPKQSENLFVPGNYLLENVFPQQNRRKIYEIRYCNTGQKIFSTEKYNRVRVVKNCMQSSGTNPVWCSYELYAIHMIPHYFLNWRRKVTLHILIQLWELVFQRIKKDCRCLFDPEEILKWDRGNRLGIFFWPSNILLQVFFSTFCDSAWSKVW